MHNPPLAKKLLATAVMTRFAILEIVDEFAEGGIAQEPLVEAVEYLIAPLPEKEKQILQIQSKDPQRRLAFGATD